MHRLAPIFSKKCCNQGSCITKDLSIIRKNPILKLHEQTLAARSVTRPRALPKLTEQLETLPPLRNIKGSLRKYPLHKSFLIAVYSVLLPKLSIICYLLYLCDDYNVQLIFFC